MLLINSDLTARVFSEIEFILSEGSQEHATDRNFKPSNHTGVRADRQLKFFTRQFFVNISLAAFC